MASPSADAETAPLLIDPIIPARRHNGSFFGILSLGQLTKRVPLFEPQVKSSPLERDLVHRLDVFLMTFGCISQVIKYLDQTNISSAYVSGMKEDLGLHGDELNYFTTYFSISYCLMLIPSQIIITYVRPSYWLPGLEIGWGLVTAMIALAQNAHQVYALRVLLGLFESSAWPGMMTLFMYWYTPTELATRMGFYHSCQALGSMVSGALQVAILETLEGKLGLRGWRWLFVINGIMTLVVGLAGFFMLPDYPNQPNPRAAWLTNEHAAMASERLERHGRSEAKRITWASAKRTFTMWAAYLIPTLYIATVLAPYGYNYFNLFLKSLSDSDGTPTWTTEQVNAIPIAGGAINVIFVWIWAILSDVFQTRWALLVAQAAIGLIPCIIMSVWTSSPSTTLLSAAYAGYLMTYLSLGTAPLVMSWLSDLLPQDPEARTLIVGYSIAGVYAVLSWSQVLIWPASQAPYYKYAWQLSIIFWIVVIVMVWGMHKYEPYLRTKKDIACSLRTSAEDDGGLDERTVVE
ncbi:major facilitator superfamily domain-containing protein [Lasiosphaeria hispida]|uniref:Major facilitator superfamily domain-containing protein n=1 Tax=Lasiosphaeria hispida TaxID=260671 RepID=A0AAJ0HGM5_9PEZI|nr:major facilitator superfamily domain-containing protein [Lasiosphaeria hispida]